MKCEYRHETHCNIPIYSAFGQTLECIGENKCEVFQKYKEYDEVFEMLKHICDKHKYNLNDITKFQEEIKEKNNGKKSKGVS